MERFLVDRMEIQLATISELIYRGAGGKDATAIDFMPSLEKEIKEKLKEEQKQIALIKKLDAFGED